MPDKFDEIKMDWQQALLNGGPPCFHVEGKGFCGRAQRWPGHDEMHKYRSLAQAMRNVQQETAEACWNLIHDESVKRYGSWMGSPAFMAGLRDAIAERFGLKETK